MRAGALVEWLSMLERLQLAASTQLHKSFMKQWVALGTALGLDVTKERQRRERTRCSWLGCRYHTENLSEDKLKACAGCGETRYCGRDCQKR